MGRTPTPPPAKNSGCLILTGGVLFLFLMLLIFVVAVINGHGK